MILNNDQRTLVIDTLDGLELALNLGNVENATAALATLSALYFFAQGNHYRGATDQDLTAAKSWAQELRENPPTAGIASNALAASGRHRSQSFIDSVEELYQSGRDPLSGVIKVSARAGAGVALEYLYITETNSFGKHHGAEVVIPWAEDLLREAGRL